MERTLSSLNEAIRQNPRNAMLFNLRGLLHVQMHRPGLAVSDFETAVNLEPRFAEAFSNRGNLLRHLHRGIEAEASYKQAIGINASFFEAYCNYGVLLRQLGRVEEALALYDKALQINPRFAIGYHNRASALRDLGRFEEALVDCREALSLSPTYADAYCNQALVLLDLIRPDEALASCDKALALDPAHVAALNHRGNALRDLRRTDEALATYKRALRIAPQNPDVLFNVAVLLREIGALEASRDTVDKALRQNPHDARSLRLLSEAKRFTRGDPTIALMETLADRPSFGSHRDRTDLLFALGKAYADIDDHERSFGYFLEANQIRRRQIRYDEAEALGCIDRIRQTFTRDVVRRRAFAVKGSVAPIFVVGMPRSGTTLVEQILASHPDVHAAGELETFRTSVYRHERRCGPYFDTPGVVPQISDEALREIGRDYVEAVQTLASGSERVTDKLPDNFRLIGLIHMALPEARIVHVRRDPLDTCVSCFTTSFHGHQPFAYDLAELGRYYSAYRTLMQHWTEVLPAGTIVEVDYEDLVSDLQTQTARLLARCGLDWNDRCLAFWKTERPVFTASVAQVRQPLYKSSVGRWRPYEPFLQPLIAALGDALPAA